MSASFVAHLAAPAQVWNCEGFRMTARRDGAADVGAVVRKPPKNEPAMEDRVRRCKL